MPPMDPRAVLQRHFGHGSFRPGQEEIVRAALAGRDLLAVMPTGSGKSIGYQLPAVMLEGPTLVVSPLIALMKDQVDELTRKGIAAAALHSLASPAERREAEAALRAGRLRLFYVAPERFASERFRRILEEVPLARFAVDEAHCVSEWGHDFRPDYRGLAEAAGRCRRADGFPGRPPILAFTATATPEVRDDIVDLLGLVDPDVSVAGFDRPNLFLDVRKVSGEIEKRALLPELVAGRRALVYAATRKSAARAAEALREAGVGADAYHAGMDESERTRVQDRFADGSLRVVCATNAFGMGIDRPDIDAVVHFEIPGSLEAYYQEIGRGGRDGRRSDATLLWNYVDVRTREFLIDQTDERDSGAEAPHRERRRELDRSKLARMIAYADSSACYRATILGYFGERDAASACGFCGNCARRRDLSEEDLLRLRKILSGVARGGERWGKRKLVAMLTGELEGLPEPLTPPLDHRDPRGREPAGRRRLGRRGAGRRAARGDRRRLPHALADARRARGHGRAHAAGRADAPGTAAPETEEEDEDVEGACRGRRRHGGSREHRRPARVAAPGGGAARGSGLRRAPRPHARRARGRAAGDARRPFRDSRHRAGQARGLRQGLAGAARRRGRDAAAYLSRRQ